MIEPAKYGLKLKVVLKWRLVYMKVILRVGSLVDRLKIAGFVKWRRRGS